MSIIKNKEQSQSLHSLEDELLLFQQEQEAALGLDQGKKSSGLILSPVSFCSKIERPRPFFLGD
jgi:hypothetical protein